MKIDYRVMLHLLTIGVLSAAIFLLFMSVHQPKAHDLSHYSTDAQNWFKEQRRNGNLCCSAADFDQVDEEIRYDSGEPRYWINSDKTRGEWIIVPKAAVLTSPNPNGRAVAWYRWVSPDGSFSSSDQNERKGFKIEVYCFSPGSLY